MKNVKDTRSVGLVARYVFLKISTLLLEKFLSYDELYPHSLNMENIFEFIYKKKLMSLIVFIVLPYVSFRRQSAMQFWAKSKFL